MDRYRRSQKASLYLRIAASACTLSAHAAGAEHEAAPKNEPPSLSPPQASQTGVGLAPLPAPAPLAKPATSEPRAQVTGYLHAPLRASWGPPTYATNFAGTQQRTPPLVADADDIDYRYTANLGGPWTELNFQYGNELARATVQTASYNLIDAAYRRLEANLGISQAFVALNPQPVLAGRGHVSLTGGGFSNRYGAAGLHSFNG